MSAPDDSSQSNPFLLALVAGAGILALWFLAPEIFGRKSKV